MVYRDAMRVLVTVLLLVGCASSQRTPVKRWPYHREQAEERFAQLQRKLESLEQRLTAVEAANRQHAKPPAETPPAP